MFCVLKSRVQAHSQSNCVNHVPPCRRGLNLEIGWYSDHDHELSGEKKNTILFYSLIMVNINQFAEMIALIYFQSYTRFEDWPWVIQKPVFVSGKKDSRVIALSWPSLKPIPPSQKILTYQNTRVAVHCDDAFIVARDVLFFKPGSS